MFIPIHWSFSPLLRRFDSFQLSFADKVMRETYSFASLIVKMILSGLVSVAS